MFLRGLSSLLTRRFSPLGNRSAQAMSSLGIGIQKAPGSAEGRPARSFHTLRDLADGGGVYGAAATAAITGFVAALYYNTVNKNSDVAAEVTGEAAEVAVEEKEIVKEPYVSREAAIKAGFVDKDGKVNWPEYFDYVNFQTNYGGMPLYDKEEYAKEVTNREAVTRKKNREAVKWEDVKVDEPIMKARFEDWMKEYGRSYRSEQEKARRYEIFKKTAARADIDNASRPKGACIFAPNGFADWSEEECKAFDCRSDWNWDTYVDHINKMAANGWDIGNEKVKTSEAVKQMIKELRTGLRARKREGK